MKKLSILKRIIIGVFLIGCGSIAAQSSLDNYVEIGIKNNLVLQQKNIGLEKALYSLKTANSLFFPTINIKGDYQSGEGGRTISLPLGDMFNPVYNTLNQLTASNAFPQINNMDYSFFPYNYYDVKVRTVIPIYNSDLIYNRKIQKEQVVMQECDVAIYKSELIKNIKVAYYNYLSAVKSVFIYENALKLAQEGKKINESLLNNGKSIKAYILRSESEIQNLEAKKTTAQQQVNNAQMYFNFLINAETNQNIDTLNVPSINQTIIKQYLLNEASVNNRTELKVLEQSASISETVYKMNKAYWHPKINAYLDLGSQESDWKFNNKSKYYFFGVQLDVPLFAAGKNRYNVKFAELDLKNQQLNNSNINNQLQLSAKTAKNNLLTSFENYKASLKELDAAAAYFNLIEKGYKEGVNTFIETVDSRSQYTAASLQEVISKYQLLAAVAAYEREINN